MNLKSFAFFSSGIAIASLMAGCAGFIALSNATQAEAVIGSGGGVLSLLNRAQVTFPAGSFNKGTKVSLELISNPSSQEPINPIFGDTTGPAEFIVLDIGDAVIESDNFTFEITLSPQFLNQMPPNNGPEAFLWLTQTDGSPISGWELVESNYSSSENKLSIKVPGFLVSKIGSSSSSRQLRVRVASTPGLHTDGTLQALLGRGQGGCQATSIGNPLATINVQEAFGELRKQSSGTYRLHWGADLTASSTDPILSAGKGKIDFLGTKNGYEKTIVVLHDSGVRTLYAHLNSFDVPDGQGGTKRFKKDDRIELGAQIATGVKKTADAAGTGVTPHLHFELAPSGDIFQKKNKTNPMSCTGNEVSGSIEFGDNGTLADDSFTLSITPIAGGGADTGHPPFTFGPSAIGQRSFPVAISNLRIGEYKLSLECNIAPDNVGTYFIRLSDNIVFKTGDELLRSGSLPVGGKFEEPIVVFSQNAHVSKSKLPIPPSISNEGH